MKERQPVKKIENTMSEELIEISLKVSFQELALLNSAINNKIWDYIGHMNGDADSQPVHSLNRLSEMIMTSAKSNDHLVIKKEDK